MKIRRLYIKILLSFLGMLAATLSLILILFIFTAGWSYRAQLDEKTLSKLQVFQAQVQEKIGHHPDKDLGANPDLKNHLAALADLFDVRIWITDPSGNILIRTFSGPADVPQTGVHRQIHHDNGITLYHFVLRWIKYYATIPVLHQGRDLRLHLFYDTRDPDHPEGLFLVGILAVGGVVALLVIPLATFITRRINLLNQSALAFADGNLSCRAQIKGHDEIAKLGDSFNLMADKLEALVQNTKELTANVSHELRSPLARLRVSKELILDKVTQGGGKTEIQRYVDSMESDIQQLDTLVSHMLTLSRMDYQESQVARERFTLWPFLEKELGPYQSLAAQAGLTLSVNVPTQAQAFQDKAVLRSILSNLLDNAVKYTDQGGAISVSAALGPGRQLVILVENPCPPISQDQLNLLFKPFFRIPGQKAQGSGLGLTIAKKQAQRCQGDLTAEKTAQGILFRVTLP